MEQTNQFSIVMASKSDEELNQIKEDDSYTLDARLACVWELEKRNGTSEELDQLKAELLNIDLEQQRRKASLQSDPEEKEDVPIVIKNAARLLYVSLALSVVGTLFQMEEMTMAIPGPFLLVLLIIFMLYGFLFYAISLGKNWARITFTVLFGIGMLGMLFALTQTRNGVDDINYLSLIQTILQITAVVFLYSRDANAWYNREKVVTKPSQDLIDDL